MRDSGSRGRRFESGHSDARSQQVGKLAAAALTAPIVQGIEQRFPKPPIQVRVLVGAPKKTIYRVLAQLSLHEKLATKFEQFHF